MTRIFRFALLLAPLLLAGAAHAQPSASAFAERGLPTFRAFGPDDHGGEAQSWAFAQTPDGTLFVGNDGGVLIYDGVRWTRLALPRGVVARSLDVDAEGRVWVGAQGDFGYLAPDSLGRMAYVSLVERLAEEHRSFRDVWGTAVTPHGVYFLSGAHVARWHEGRLAVEPAGEGSRFVFLLRPDDATLLATEVGPEGSAARGLLRVADGRFERLPGGDAFARRTARIAAPHPEGLLVGDDHEGLRLLRPDGTLVPFPTEADALLAERRLFFGRPLPGERLAVWTYGGGLALLDARGRLLDVLDADAGLPSPLTYTVFPDREGGLWLGQNTGIVRLPRLAPERFDRDAGLTGSPRTIRRFGGLIHVATDLGVFRLRPADGLRRAAFERISGLDTEAWALVPLGERLIVGATAGVFALQDGRVERLSPRYGRVLAADGESIVFAGGDGLGRLDRTPPGWTETHLADLDAEIPNSITIGTDGAVWLGTKTSGVLRFADGALTRFGPDEGVPEGFSAVTHLHGRLVASTLDGARRLDGGRFVPAEGLAIPGGPPMFGATEWGDDLVAAFGMPPAMRVAWLHGHGDGTYTRVAADPYEALGARSLTELHVEADGTAWIGTDVGILRFRAAERPTPHRAVRLAGLYARADSLLYGGFGPAPAVFSADVQALRFLFAASTFDGLTRYRSRLDGMERDWTPWTDEPQRDVTNLAPGRYTLHVEALGPGGVAIEPLVFAFAIRPPWYGTAPARLLWIVLAAGLVGLVARRGPEAAERLWARLPHRRVVSHYRLDALLGAGGAGQVWRARNLGRRPDQPRFVAVKLLHEQTHADAAADRQRLRREADLLLSLDHPHIVRVYETGLWNGTPFVAMELLDGETLRRRIERAGALPVAEARAHLRTLAEALGAVHSAGMVHRDVKSDNVMLVPDGEDERIVLMDFGLARTAHLTTLTQLGQLLGTLGYAAPEQAMGHDADPRSDVFAFGVVAYEVLTGRLPFRGDNEIAVLQAIFNHEPAPPHALRPDVPEPLSRLVMDCLAKEPDLRPASGGALAERLAALAPA